MFVWWSGGSGGSRWGCCGGILFLPLALFTMSAGFGGDSFWLLLIGVTIVAALFVLPRMMNADGEKRKNDDYADDEKPKSEGERYILTDDGEILDVTDDAENYGNSNRLN